MPISYLREACLETLQDCIHAEQQGADRIELCSRLDLDGLSPGVELTQEVLKSVSIPVRAMVRPREGDFVYSAAEIQQMESEIDRFKTLGVEGIVLGVLTSAGHIDLSLLKDFIERARPLKVTFHRAIEQTPDLIDAIKLLVQETSIDSILTSGGASHASENVALLAQAIEAAQNRELIVCGKVTHENLPELHRQLGARAYHGKKVVKV